MGQMLGEVAVGQYVDPTRLTVDEYLTNQWLPLLASRVRPTTEDTYRRLVKAHIIPALGNVRLQKLDRATVAAWLGDLTRKKLSPKSVRNVHGILAKALNDAVDLELVSRNVATRSKLPAARPSKPKAWTADELTAFLNATRDDRLQPLWRFLAMTGCRRGEALGLRWSDVDLAHGRVTVTHQRTIAGGRVVEGSPKTAAGARTIALDAVSVSTLKTWRTQQVQERLMMGSGWPETDLVFTNPDGGGLWPQRVTRQFGETTDRLGLPPVGVHGLRHTAATYLISSGVNPKVVQQRLGHAQVSVTLGLYTHVLPAHDEDAAAVLASAVTNL
jgi:integrase